MYAKKDFFHWKNILKITENYNSCQTNAQFIFCKHKQNSYVLALIPFQRKISTERSIDRRTDTRTDRRNERWVCNLVPVLWSQDVNPRTPSLGPSTRRSPVIPLVSPSASTCLSLPTVGYPHPTFHLRGVLQTSLLPLQLCSPCRTLTSRHRRTGQWD